MNLRLAGGGGGGAGRAAAAAAARPASAAAGPSAVVAPLASSSRARLSTTTAARATAPVSTAAADAAAPASGEGGEVAKRVRVLSGVQPTGDLHLGNYLGAIRPWVALQAHHDAFFCVVDLHAITVQPHDPGALRAATRSAAALYLAAGVDPGVATIFTQSHVPAHAELAWLLQCVTPLGWLHRMTQYKEKARAMRGGGGDGDGSGGGEAGSEEEEESDSGSGGGASPSSRSSGGGGGAAGGGEVGAGLLTYPVLMASDILLYRAGLVPVGADQKQHIELARDLAGRVNARFGGRGWKKLGGRGGRLLTVPEPLIQATGARVMSLTDGTAKMSKSNPAPGSRINLLDPPELIAAKIKRAKTDAEAGVSALAADGVTPRPEAANLLTIYSAVTGLTPEAAAADVAGLSWGAFKPRLADAVVEHLAPLQAAYAAFAADPAGLDGVLGAGAERAGAVAEATLADVRQAMGFVARPPPPPPRT